MSVRQSTLRDYANRAGTRSSKTVVSEAIKSNNQTAFLSHSHKDAALAKGVQEFLQSKGWKVYIDWEDCSMPDKPNRKTAENIQKRIKQLDWFLFLATNNSINSKWCPWELGYADGVKKYDSIVVIGTSDSLGNYYGNEYMQLYRSINTAKGGGWGAFYPNDTGRLLNEMRADW